MKGYLINKDGTQFQLPELLSWDVCHGTGEPCDYFEVKTVYSNTLLPKLEEAVRFKGTSDEQTVFFGVVDEYQISIDERGSTVSINGRSLAAVLMDNEVQKHTYYSMTRDKVIEKYVSPYGISDIAETAMPQVLIFTVKDGDSAWSVLKRYCLKSLHSSPCFDPAGKLHMRKRTGKSLQINADEQAVSAKYKDERYGIISEISVINRSSGGSYTVSYTHLRAHETRLNLVCRLLLLLPPVQKHLTVKLMPHLRFSRMPGGGFSAGTGGGNTFDGEYQRKDDERDRLDHKDDRQD